MLAASEAIVSSHYWVSCMFHLVRRDELWECEQNKLSKRPVERVLGFYTYRLRVLFNSKRFMVSVVSVESREVASLVSLSPPIVRNRNDME